MLKTDCENGEFHFDILRAFSDIPANWPGQPSLSSWIFNIWSNSEVKIKLSAYKMSISWCANKLCMYLSSTIHKLKTSLKANEIDWQELITEEHTIARK